MFLGFAEVITKNARFESALDRTFRDRKTLQSRLEPIDLDGRFDTLWFIIGDHPLNYFKVNHKADDRLYQVFVGYDLAGDYPRDRDKSVIGMIAGWLRRVFTETDGYAAKRKELLDIVNTWEAETTNRIAP
jgi:hypothetical protein